MRRLFSLLFLFGLFLRGGPPAPAQSGPAAHDLGQRAWIDSSGTSPVFHYTWWGSAGKNYLVQVSEDLHSWSFLPGYNPAGADAALGIEFTYESPRVFVRAWQFDPLDLAGFADSDGDGVADLWEQYHFGDLEATSADRTSDQNGDGITDREAWLLGLNPAAPLPDRIAPTWPLGAALTVAAESATSLTLAWPQAEDDRPGAVRHVLYRNDQPQGAPGAALERTVDLSGLTGWQRWQVRPADAAGNLGPALGTVSREVNPVVDAGLSAWTKRRSTTLAKWGFEPFQTEPEFAPVVRSFATRTVERTKHQDYYPRKYDRYTHTISSAEQTAVWSRWPSAAMTVGYSGDFSYYYNDPGIEHHEYAGTWQEDGSASGSGVYQNVTYPVTGAPGSAEHYPFGFDGYDPVTTTATATEFAREYQLDLSLELEWGPKISITHRETLSDPITDEAHEAAAVAALPDPATLEWLSPGILSPESFRDWSPDRLSLRLTDSLYKARVSQTQVGKRYRVRWLEVFYPEPPPGQPAPPPRSLAYREVVLDGTGEAVESEVFTLSPPGEDGTVVLKEVDATLDTPGLLVVNDNYDERVPTDPEDEDAPTPPWVADMDTPSPVRADGTLALDGLEPVWPGSHHPGATSRFGPETSGVRLTLVEGAERARLIAVAPEGGGEDGAYTASDWAVVADGEELWGNYYGRTDAEGRSLPDWTVYLEGLEPGRVGLALEVDRYGETLTVAAVTDVVRVKILAVGDDGELEPVGAWIGHEEPRPEVAVEITEAEILADGSLELSVTGHVRDRLGELFAEPKHQVQGVVFWVNGQPVDALGGLPAKGDGPGLAPWQTRGSRVEFSRRIVVPAARPGAYVLEARSTPDLSGRRGWAKAAVRVGFPLVANPPPPPGADASFALAGPLDPATPDLVRVYRGARAPQGSDPVFVETGPDTRIFAGFWTDDLGATVQARLELGRGLALDPARIEEAGAVFAWLDGQGATHRVEGRWTEGAAAAGWFAPSAFTDRAAPRELKVEGVHTLSAAEAVPPSPLVVRVEGLPDEFPVGEISPYLEFAGESHALVRLELDGGGWFLARPDSTDSPLALLAPPPSGSGAWLSPTGEVRLIDDAGAGVVALRGMAATASAPTDFAQIMRAKARKIGRRGAAEAQAYLESQGYYDEEPEDEELGLLTLEELRGWTVTAYGRPSYLAMRLFIEERGGVVEMVDMSWTSPFEKLRGYTVSNQAEEPRIRIDANLEPVRAAEVFMEALTEMLGHADSLERLRVLSMAANPAPFTYAELETMMNGSFRAAWTGALGQIETLLQAQEAGIRIVFSPLDMVVTISEAAEGDKAAMLSVALAATPIDNLLGINKKIVRGGESVVQTFSPALQANVRTILTGSHRMERLKRAEVMLGTGAITVADWHKLVDSGIFKQSKKYSRFLAREGKRLSGSFRPPGTVLHHYLPLDTRFEMKFIRAGLDPNDPQFTDWVEAVKHMGWHQGSGLGGKFNQEWDTFFSPTNFPNATAAQIIGKYNQLRRKYQP